jgi:hypothetical protein
MDFKSWKLVGRDLKLFGGHMHDQMLTHFVKPFPVHLDGEERIAQTILMYRGCSDAVVWLKPLLLSSLEGG